jgi:hypothetical protein
MTTSELMAYCATSLENNSFLVFDDVVLKHITRAQAEVIQHKYGSHKLMYLPTYEIEFFEWLRSEDPDVWNDLWAADERPAYVVSLAHLSDFCGQVEGVFHIRDLQSVDNYFFSPEMLLEKESADFLNAVRNRYTQHQSMTVAQLLALEVSTGPVDIWHFAYRRKLKVADVKIAVRQLVDDRILLHVPNADHLSQLFHVS